MEVNGPMTPAIYWTIAIVWTIPSIVIVIVGPIASVNASFSTEPITQWLVHAIAIVDSSKCVIRPLNDTI